ncbi:protein takeout isoform X2 [Drosophila sechellia]|uniref:protein takeout isoform X2 n=1 Tax=Drosophila sechellia TaxID=7238 RepID=UPI0013DD8D6D|nr:protein takeout isoform X2 [Drosophila sechellia]
MDKLISLTFLCWCIPVMISGASLPEDVEKCHFGDSTCLVRSINALIKHYPKGIPEIGLPPLDAYNFPDSVIMESPNRGPIWMDFRMRDNVNKGFNNATITHVEGFLYEPNQKQIVLKNFRITLTIKALVEYRNDKRYLKIYNLVPSLDLDRWIIWLDGLYKENTDVTVFMNKLVNDNWVEFWNDLQPGLVKAFTDAFTVLLNRVFDNVAYDDMFLPYVDIRMGS